MGPALSSKGARNITLKLLFHFTITLHSVSSLSLVSQTQHAVHQKGLLTERKLIWVLI